MIMIKNTFGIIQTAPIFYIVLETPEPYPTFSGYFYPLYRIWFDEGVVTLGRLRADWRTDPSSAALEEIPMEIIV